MTFTVVYDANVLYPNTLRDLLIRIAQSGAVLAKWTNAILDEMAAALRRNRPDIPAQKIGRLRELMNRAVRDCLVSGYEPLMEGLKLPDPDDRHVLAAAIKVGAQVIVTRNLKDFPAETLDRYDIEAQHPDEFLHHMMDLAPVAFVDAVRLQQANMANPPVSMNDLLALFERIGLAETVAELRRLIG
jgi:predicted nucleic acid-binding protein